MSMTKVMANQTPFINIIHATWFSKFFPKIGSLNYYDVTVKLMYTVSTIRLIITKIQLKSYIINYNELTILLQERRKMRIRCKTRRLNSREREYRSQEHEHKSQHS